MGVHLCEATGSVVSKKSEHVLNVLVGEEFWVSQHGGWGRTFDQKYKHIDGGRLSG